MVYEFSPWVICFALSVTGVVLGAVFDLYRTIRYFLEPGRWITALGDLLYWTGVTALIFGLFSLLAHGEIRVYFFMFLALGVALYYAWLSVAVLKLYLAIGRLVARVLGFIHRVLAKLFWVLSGPVRVVWRVLVVPMRWSALPLRRLEGRIQLWYRRRVPPTPPPPGT